MDEIVKIEIRLEKLKISEATINTIKKSIIQKKHLRLIKIRISVLTK